MKHSAQCAILLPGAIISRQPNDRANALIKLVRDLMRPSLITCLAGTTLDQAANLLARHGIHALVISDRAGLAIGVLSNMDLLAGN